MDFHPRRHPFSSNLARTGVDDRTIDHSMGHQTEEMRRRYQHLFPEEKRKALGRLEYCVVSGPHYGREQRGLSPVQSQLCAAEVVRHVRAGPVGEIRSPAGD